MDECAFSWRSDRRSAPNGSVPLQNDLLMRAGPNEQPRCYYRHVEPNRLRSCTATSDAVVTTGDIPSSSRAHAVDGPASCSTLNAMASISRRAQGTCDGIRFAFFRMFFRRSSGGDCRGDKVYQHFDLRPFQMLGLRTESRFCGHHTCANHKRCSGASAV
jgi:hypothetical protein